MIVINQDEYWKQQDEKIDSMSLEDLRIYIKKEMRLSQDYFHRWMEADRKLDLLRITRE